MNILSKNITILFLLGIILSACSSTSPSKKDVEMDKFVKDLLSRMKLEETIVYINALLKVDFVLE